MRKQNRNVLGPTLRFLSFFVIFALMAEAAGAARGNPRVAGLVTLVRGVCSRFLENRPSKADQLEALVGSLPKLASEENWSGKIGNWVVYKAGPSDPAVLVIKSPSLDPSLISWLAKLRVKTQGLGELQKVKAVAEFVSETLKPPKPVESNLFTQLVHRGGYILLGQFIEIGQAECRETSLLSQIALEEVGVDSRIERGTIRIASKDSGDSIIFAHHLWNRVNLTEDRSSRLLDVQNGRIGTDIFPPGIILKVSHLSEAHGPVEVEYNNGEDGYFQNRTIPLSQDSIPAILRDIHRFRD